MSSYKNVYFVGIGGIGMSAIARYYNHEGYNVAGYDRTQTPLTSLLENEGIDIHYSDNLDLVPAPFLDKDNTLVIYTPAIPNLHSELCYFFDNGFNIVKRSKALGELSKGKRLIAVAGTHGKTSTSTMVAWFSHKASTNGGGSGFLGGISKNLNSNLLLGGGDRLTVEADEFDRSFLQLFPDIAVVNSTDADHLDIYGSHEAMKESFTKFTSQIKSGGVLIYRKGIDLVVTNSQITKYTFALDDKMADFYGQNITLSSDGLYTFDIVTPFQTILGCKLGIGGQINVENCIAAVAATIIDGCDIEKLKEAITSFKGVKRRFETYVNRPDKVYIDDYAHHPRELTATIKSIRELYSGRKVTIIFQPHLYTRTRDFSEGFSKALSLADRVILLPIYPARELPIEGVSSQMLLDGITIEDKMICEKEQLLDIVSKDENPILVTFGAGDIDCYCEQIAKLLQGE